MQCSKCGNPLKVIHGGEKVADGKIIMVHIFGCINPECELKMAEQNRTETEINRFDG